MTLYEQFEELMDAIAKGGDPDVSVLSDVAAVWLGKPEEPLVLGMVGCVRALVDSTINYQEGGVTAERSVVALWSHSVTQTLRNFQALIAVTDVQKKLDERG